MQKSFILIFFVLLLTQFVLSADVCSLAAGRSYSDVFSGGDGSASNPYNISNCVQLQMVGCVGGENNRANANFRLISDVNCYAETHVGGALWFDGEGFNPIELYAYYSSDLPASFDGWGHKIFGLYINRYYDDTGLFGFADLMSIYNLTIEGAEIHCGSGCGAVAGYARNSLLNGIQVINSRIDSTGMNVGGIIGVASQSELRNSRTNSVLVRSTCTGDAGHEDSYIGGLVGQGSNFILKASESQSIVRGDGNTCQAMGGLVGFLYQGLIKDSVVNPILKTSLPRCSSGSLSGCEKVEITINGIGPFNQFVTDKNIYTFISSTIGQEGCLDCNNYFTIVDLNKKVLFSKTLEGDVTQDSNVIIFTTTDNVTHRLILRSLSGKVLLSFDSAPDENLLSIQDYSSGASTDGRSLSILTVETEQKVSGGVVSGWAEIGGLVGNVIRSKIDNSVNNVDVVPEYMGSAPYLFPLYYTHRVGGLVGESADVDLENSINNGVVAGREYVGGLIGHTSNEVVARGSSNNGNVFGSKYLAGLFYNSNYHTVCNSINNARVLNVPGPFVCGQFANGHIYSWYCDKLGTLCSYNNYADCNRVFSGDVKYCFVGDLNEIAGPYSSNGYLGTYPYHFYWIENGEYTCDNRINSCKTLQPNQGECIGPYFAKYYSSESYYFTGLTEWTTIGSIDSNTSRKCESWCDSDSVLIYVGGVVPVCHTISPGDGCINENGVCDSGCNILTDSDCTVKCVNGDNICAYPCTWKNDSDCAGPQCSYCEDNYYLSCPSDCSTFTCSNGSCTVLGTNITCQNTCPQKYLCVGSVPQNAIMYFDDNTGLTSNTQNTLSQTNTLTKCEYYCPTGYHQGAAGTADENNCLINDCSWIPNQDCPYYCNSSNDADCSGGTCIGSFANAFLIPFDNNGFFGSLDSVLVFKDSFNKCEWLCEEDFVKGLGSDENVCMNEFGYNCVAPSDGNAVLYAGDNISPVSYYDHFGVLSASDTSRKCEYFCNSEFDLELIESLQKCVPRGLDLGICGDANRIYYMGEDFPSGNSFCDNGYALYTEGLVLPEYEGGLTLPWKCVGRDGNSWCTAKRSSASIFDVNAILDLNARYDGTNLFISVKCSKPTVASLVLSDGNSAILLNPVTVNCGPVLSTGKFNTSSDLIAGKIYSVKASILSSSPDCSVCSRTDFFSFTQAQQSSVPDNSIVALIFVLLSVVFIFAKNNKQGKN